MWHTYVRSVAAPNRWSDLAGGGMCMIVVIGAILLCYLIRIRMIWPQAQMNRRCAAPIEKR